MNAGVNLGGRGLLQSSDYVITATGPGRRRWKKTLVKLKKQWKKGESAVKRQQSIGEKRGKRWRKVRSPNIRGRSCLKRRRKKQKRAKTEREREQSKVDDVETSHDQVIEERCFWKDKELWMSSFQF